MWGDGCANEPDGGVLSACIHTASHHDGHFQSPHNFICQWYYNKAEILRTIPQSLWRSPFMGCPSDLLVPNSWVALRNLQF